MPRHKIGPAQSKLDISDEPLMREFSRENAGEQMEHPDLTPALTLTVRTLSVDIWFGEKPTNTDPTSNINFLTV